MREFLLRSYTDDEAEVCKRVGLEEVVRCKDCRYSGKCIMDLIQCKISRRLHAADWFCKDGKRKGKVG